MISQDLFLIVGKLILTLFFTFKFKLRYEDVCTAKKMFKIEDFMFTLDLKSPNHLIEMIYNIHKKCIGSFREENEKTKLFIMFYLSVFL